jgi:hypothetical protein
MGGAESKSTNRRQQQAVQIPCCMPCCPKKDGSSTRTDDALPEAHLDHRRESRFSTRPEKFRLPKLVSTSTLPIQPVTDLSFSPDISSGADAAESAAAAPELHTTLDSPLSRGDCGVGSREWRPPAPPAEATPGWTSQQLRDLDSAVAGAARAFGMRPPGFTAVRVFHATPLPPPAPLALPFSPLPTLPPPFLTLHLPSSHSSHPTPYFIRMDRPHLFFIPKIKSGSPLQRLISWSEPGLRRVKVQLITF